MVQEGKAAAEDRVLEVMAQEDLVLDWVLGVVVLEALVELQLPSFQQHYLSVR